MSENTDRFHVLHPRPHITPEGLISNNGAVNSLTKVMCTAARQALFTCHASSVSWRQDLKNILLRPIILVRRLFQLLLNCCQDKHDCLINIILAVFSVQAVKRSQFWLVRVGIKSS